MQLIIDIGNTRIKATFFDNNELKNKFVANSIDELLAANWFCEAKIERSIISTVTVYPEKLVNAIKQKCEPILFSASTPVPIINKYNSAQTLGSDRLAAAVGGNFNFPNTNLLIIDAGTCVKYNFVNSNNEYLGGGISPGLKMRFQSLHNFTARLPLVEFDKSFNTLIGTNTKASILSGIQNGMIAEIDGIIDGYKKEFPNLKVLLTGGDVDFFEKQLKNSIFADFFLIEKGLNTILNYNFNNLNVEKK
ncbi:MAG TPA: type III pantothenate kinase [Bacteroidia bacterium]|nr:type III pantothenate kinase [Bacteroidia bacterium]